MASYKVCNGWGWVGMHYFCDKLLRKIYGVVSPKTTEINKNYRLRILYYPYSIFNFSHFELLSFAIHAFYKKPRSKPSTKGFLISDHILVRKVS